MTRLEYVYGCKEEELEGKDFLEGLEYLITKSTQLLETLTSVCPYALDEHRIKEVVEVKRINTTLLSYFKKE